MENDINDKINDQENIDKEDKNEQLEPEDEDKEPDNTVEEESDSSARDSIRELFSRVFINDSWFCASQVEKPYYSTGIYPDICIECGNLDVSKPAKGEYPHCNNCSSNAANSKKCLRWEQGNKNN